MKDGMLQGDTSPKDHFINEEKRVVTLVNKGKKYEYECVCSL